MDKTYELIKLAQAGDEKAKETIIKENSGLIWSVVRKFTGRGYEMEDLYQIGAIGLIKCIKKFDPTFEVKFSTYAIPMIMGEIKRFLRDDGMIKVSRPLKEIAAKSKYLQESFTQKNGRPPTVSELAKLAQVSVEDLTMAMESSFEIESLQQTIYQNDGTPIYLIDKIGQSQSGDKNILDNIVLKDIIERLEPREKEIIIMRYYFDKTQSEIASLIGISQVQVSRIEKKVLKTIREKFG